MIKFRTMVSNGIVPASCKFSALIGSFNPSNQINFILSLNTSRKSIYEDLCAL